MFRTRTITCAAVLLFCSVVVGAAGEKAMATYYVDATGGDDGNTGTSLEEAWQTLANVNATTFEPGDRILFKAGTSYAGGMWLHGSGTSDAPIAIDSYGEGARPRINGQITLSNVEYWEVGNLEISEPGSRGVFVHAKDFGVAHHIEFRNLYIHDVDGGTTGDTGAFICRNEGVTTVFDGLLIENCRIERADRNGILVTDFPTRSTDPEGAEEHLSLNVVIRGNYMNDIGGDGIFIIGCDGGLIERNTLRYAHQRVGREPGERACAGIWPACSDNCIVQFNEVSHTAVGGVTVWDSEAFDSDHDCNNCIFQYNYSHDNAGGFQLVCGGNTDTIIRYNISQNDGVATFSIEKSTEEPLENVRIYNNVIYVGPELAVNLARNTANVNGTPDGVYFTNNIFYVEGQMTYDFGSIANVFFSNNAFWGNHVSPPTDLSAILADPKLASPGSGLDGIETLAGYMLQADSPCRAAGAVVIENGGRDFWGNSVPDADPPCVGAHERPMKGTADVRTQPNTAAWTLAGQDGFIYEGARDEIVTGVPPGNCTVTWHALKNYDLPDNSPETKVITVDETTVFTGDYTLRDDAFRLRVTSIMWSEDCTFAAVSFEANAPATRYYYRLYQTQTAYTSTSFHFATFDRLGDGYYLVVVMAKDADGDFAPMPCRTWFVNRTVGEDFQVYVAGYVIEGDIATFQLAANRDVKRYYVRLYGVEPGYTSSSGTVSYASLSDGMHYFVATGKDSGTLAFPPGGPARQFFYIDTTGFGPGA